MAALYKKVRAALDERDREQPFPSLEAEAEFARQLINQQMDELVLEWAAIGRTSPDSDDEDRIKDAVHARIYGMGRLQPLVDDPDIEDIQISGCDNVWLSYADGTIKRGPAVADTDADLIDHIRRIASRLGRTEREISAAHPFMHMRLPDGSRMAVMIESTLRPEINIRRHRLRETDLRALVELGTVDHAVGAFLTSAVQSRRNIVVTGLPGAGKTTLTRALCLNIPRMERFATVETAFELLLQDIPGRFPRLLAAESVESVGEAGANGRRPGEVTLTDLVERVLLMSVQRIIVGEVRGAEIGPMLEVMQLGEGGSMSTLHAKSARDAVPRMAALLGRTRGLSYEAANRWIADAVDLIVHLRYVDESAIGGRKHRFVAEIVAIEGVADGNTPQMTDVFGPGEDGRAVPLNLPPDLDNYTRAGLQEWVFDSIGRGYWEQPLVTKVPVR